MKDKIISILRSNARISFADLATELNIPEKEAAALVAEMEADGVIRGYAAIVSDEAPGSETRVKALIEVKALMGDASDNIPGVAGIGEKTALSLIAEYGDLEKLYDALDGENSMKPAVVKKLT